MPPIPKEFNDEVRYAIDGAIYAVLGQDALIAWRNHLKTHYNITSDEMPYRLDTLLEALEHLVGVTQTRTIIRAIARQVYYRYNIDFVPVEGYRLQDYLEQAKRLFQLQVEA